MTERAEPTRAPEPKARKRRRKRSSRTIGWISGVLTTLFVMFLGVGVAVAWFQSTVHTAGPLVKDKPFTIERGEGARRIAARLQQAGVITSQNLFMAHYLAESVKRRMRGAARAYQLKAGDYEFAAGASLASVMRTLETGRGVQRFITFPEGMTSYAIVERLKADNRLRGAIATVPAEGALLPNTYDLPANTTREAVLARMAQEQRDLLGELWARRAPELPITSPEEAVILASIVQREMGPRDDPKKIAGVFINRLRKRMPLQSDPTILYGLYGGAVNWGKPIYRSEKASKTAHNTYHIPALPPTPICNPGPRALEAVLNPAETDALFFVADGRGGHIFSRTLAEHRKNVREWRKIEREIRKRERAEKARKTAEAARAAQAAAQAAPADRRSGGGNDQPAAAVAAVSRGGVGNGARGDVVPRAVTTVAVKKPEIGNGLLVPLPVRKPSR